MCCEDQSNLELCKLYSHIDDKKRLLDSKRPLTQGESKRLLDDFVVEYTYNTNAIEGNSLTLHETALVLRGLTIAKKPLREHLEAIQHQSAFECICDLVSNKKPLDLAAIDNIHSLVINDRPKERGVYRRVPVRILGAISIPPNYTKIPTLMRQLVDKYTSIKEHVVKKIVSFHAEFEHIHPYIDGNGRTGRLVANLELMKAGYPPIDIKFGDRELYYDSLRDYDLTHDTAKLQDMIAHYVLKRLEEYISTLQ